MFNRFKSYIHLIVGEKTACGKSIYEVSDATENIKDVTCPDCIGEEDYSWARAS
jgi:hypothetical protein